MQEGIKSKKALEVILSKLEGFKEPSVKDEQYVTPSSIAAEVIWKAHLNGDILGKVVADLGCGTGILGIGCLLLNAKKVIFIERDKGAMEICEKNIEKLESEGYEFDDYEFEREDIKNFRVSVDTVIMNPPFGTKEKHVDKDFLLKAFEISEMTYSFHKTITNDYILHLARQGRFQLDERFDFKFMLGNTMKHHTKSKAYIQVSCYVFERIPTLGVKYIDDE